MSIETILISQFPLPYSATGSWTTMYNYMLLTGQHHINHIICPVPLQKTVKTINYVDLKGVKFLNRVRGKFINYDYNYFNYILALNTLIAPNKKYIIHIIDNSGIVVPIHHFLKQKFNRSNFFIQYCYHGFMPLETSKRHREFYNGIDEFIFLTNLSYIQFLKSCNVFTPRARIIHNGVNSKIFNRVSLNIENTLRSKLGIKENEFVFMWCSQDRPKKGLSIVLEAFSRLRVHDCNIKLLVIGVDRTISINGVQFFGRVPNKELSKFYQIADVFLFSTLCKEGFGNVLAEALKCGCYCIASKLGGVEEVLKNGEYGVLIDNPNIIEKWVCEMQKSINIIKKAVGNPFLNKIPENIYDIDSWVENINVSIKEAKTSLNLLSE